MTGLTHNKNRLHQSLNTALGGIILAVVAESLLVGVAGLAVAVIAVGMGINFARGSGSPTPTQQESDQ